MDDRRKKDANKGVKRRVNVDLFFDIMSDKGMDLMDLSKKTGIQYSMLNELFSVENRLMRNQLPKSGLRLVHLWRFIQVLDLSPKEVYECFFESVNPDSKAYQEEILKKELKEVSFVEDVEFQFNRFFLNKIQYLTTGSRDEIPKERPKFKYKDGHTPESGLKFLYQIWDYMDKLNLGPELMFYTFFYQDFNQTEIFPFAALHSLYSDVVPYRRLTNPPFLEGDLTMDYPCSAQPEAVAKRIAKRWEKNPKAKTRLKPDKFSLENIISKIHKAKQQSIPYTLMKSAIKAMNFTYNDFFQTFFGCNLHERYSDEFCSMKMEEPIGVDILAFSAALKEKAKSANIDLRVIHAFLDLPYGDLDKSLNHRIHNRLNFSHLWKIIMFLEMSEEDILRILFSQNFPE